MMTVAVLLDNPFTNDRRVQREISALAEAGYHVHLFCVGREGLPPEEETAGCTVHRIFTTEIFDIRKQGRLKLFIAPVLASDPAVVHCHDQTMLHLGCLVKKERPSLQLIYDSHELFHAWPLNLSRFGDPVLWLKSFVVRKWLIRRERRNARYIDHLVTVNGSLAKNLHRRFRLKNPPVVVRNIPEKVSVARDPSLLRRRYSLPGTTRVLVFIGSAVYPRTLNLEQVISETAGIADLALVIICGEQGGKKDLMEWVAGRGYTHVYFHPLLKPEEIGSTLASADAGLVPTWNRKDLSYWYALDNKLFEYMMSEIPILATRQPEYLGIVERWNIGVCVNPDHPGDYARGLEEILRKTGRYRADLRKAREELNWEREKQHLLALYREIAS